MEKVKIRNAVPRVCHAQGRVHNAHVRRNAKTSRGTTNSRASKPNVFGVYPQRKAVRNTCVDHVTKEKFEAIRTHWKFADLVIDPQEIVAVNGRTLYLRDGREMGVSVAAADALRKAIPSYPEPPQGTCDKVEPRNTRTTRKNLQCIQWLKPNSKKGNRKNI